MAHGQNKYMIVKPDESVQAQRPKRPIIWDTGVPLLRLERSSMVSREPMSDGSFLTLVISSPHYEETRLRPLLNTWARDIPADDIIVGTETPLKSRDLAARVTVVTTNETLGSLPCVNEGRLSMEYQEWGDFRTCWTGLNPQARAQMDSRLVPDMRVRMAVLLSAARKKLLYEKRSSPNWVLMVDDDDYVRTETVRAVLSHLNHSQPLLIGRPVQHPTNGLFHCSGDRTIAFSRALIMQWTESVSRRCLEHPMLLNGQFGDEFVGHCAILQLGVRCAGPMTDDSFLDDRGTFHPVRDPQAFAKLHAFFSDAKFHHERWVEEFNRVNNISQWRWIGDVTRKKVVEQPGKQMKTVSNSVPGIFGPETRIMIIIVVIMATTVIFHIVKRRISMFKSFSKTY